MYATRSIQQVRGLSVPSWCLNGSEEINNDIIDGEPGFWMRSVSFNRHKKIKINYGTETPSRGPQPNCLDASIYYHCSVTGPR